MSEFDQLRSLHDVGDIYAEEKGIVLKVEAETPAPLKGNRELISQALANLVDNAIKYTEPEGEAVNGAVAEIVVRARSEGDRRSPHGYRYRSGRCRRPTAPRGRFFARLEQSPSATWVRPGPKSRFGGSPAAWRRIDACRQQSWAEERHCLAAGRTGPVPGMSRPPDARLPANRQAERFRRSSCRKRDVRRLITVAPRLTDQKAAHARVSDWLAGLALGEAKTLKALLTAKPIVSTLLGGLAESSPYLSELAGRTKAVTASPRRDCNGRFRLFWLSIVAPQFRARTRPRRCAVASHGRRPRC